MAERTTVAAKKPAAKKPAAKKPAAKKPSGDGAYVALLRGINVGGNHMMPMKELTALFTEAGCSDVRTYIQSGNVVFRAGAAVVKGLHDAVERGLIARFGKSVPLVLRSQAELADCERSNPYFDKGADPTTLVVMFLDGKPTAAAVAALDPARSPPDEFVVRGRDIYLRCPNGLARTKLTNAWFDSKLSAVSTGRNWNTVLKLLAMCAE
jgi:uncharacterized protein (DUF1697 family)